MLQEFVQRSAITLGPWVPDFNITQCIRDESGSSIRDFILVIHSIVIAQDCLVSS